jgi:hypothetical protein
MLINGKQVSNAYCPELSPPEPTSLALANKVRLINNKVYYHYVPIVFHFLIPTFHLPMHINKCQTLFSFNFKYFVDHTNGEAPECGWSNINPFTSSTKVMGPGCHRDILDDYFGDWNWKKVVSLGMLFI